MQRVSNRLIEQSDIENMPNTWKKQAYRQIAKKLGPKSNFPCIFSKNAYKKGLLQFVFMESISHDQMEELKVCLTEFIEANKEWDHRISTAKPLLIVFSTQAIKSERLEDYHSFGWNVLRSIHALDPSPWPHGVDKDPSSPNWSMCFNGMQLFINMSCPAHKVRRSRNLGDHFIMVVNPRERFDVVAGDNAKGHRVRDEIRGRIEIYDNCKPCKQLGYFGSDTMEWQQYGIIEENKTRTSKCPYKID
ncbi:YqcI/YcgG family protein [Chromohalobacter israelensis]|uniref:YqcI/YcgG family protein n=1 Tax=Chromohalobacter israelensis (strain ATCC BAA-138 / DSM 3043 / CIP 106854 / NCIMB 13768 / 1H11) TaxID=290398 RepID=Q1QYL4_CHRI1|nr:YqcI/YcgG family protein [Chromohalobacter salexigens]ABE58444.1 conserved hypothetical protein [Chromohalobacter salexigens DSM 3043]